MILTTCAACAAPLAHNAPRCVRCKLRYCNSTCQHDHWRRGHKQMCKKIHRGGNAEQYNADKKYKEAVAVAVEKCADDTKGQTCFICTQAVHWKTKEGLVRGCACRGTAGVAHVSCLVEQSKILVAEALDNNLDLPDVNKRFRGWDHCRLCGQLYHGVVRHAMGWGCWKTYIGLPDDSHESRRLSSIRYTSMLHAGGGLLAGERWAEAITVYKACLDFAPRLGMAESDTLDIHERMASCYGKLGDTDKEIAMKFDLLPKMESQLGDKHPDTIQLVVNLTRTLGSKGRFSEAKRILAKSVPAARSTYGDEHEVTLRLRSLYCTALFAAPGSTLGDQKEAESTLKELAPVTRRVLGPIHPTTRDVGNTLSLIARYRSAGGGKTRIVLLGTT